MHAGLFSINILAVPTVSIPVIHPDIRRSSAVKSQCSEIILSTGRYPSIAIIPTNISCVELIFGFGPLQYCPGWLPLHCQADQLSQALPSLQLNKDIIIIMLRGKFRSKQTFFISVKTNLSKILLGK
jgi:hypothetical protein